MKSRPSWSPDGSTLAYAQLNDSGVWDIWEVSALGGSPRKVVLSATDPAWTPDGHSLVYENLADVQIWTSGMEGENPHVLAHGIPGFDETEPRVSPDGRMVAFAVRPSGAPYGELGVADVSTGTVRMLTHDNALALSPAWSPDSRTIYFSSSRGGTLNVWRIGADGSGLRQITAGEGDDAELDVSSDGKRLVFGTMRANVGLSQFDAQANAGASYLKALTTDPARNEFGPAYSPDGSRIAFFTNFKGVENESIGITDASGRNSTQLVRDSRVNLFPRWSPDGTHLIYLSAPVVSEGVVGETNELRSVAISGGAPQIIMKLNAGIPDVARDGRLLCEQNGEATAYDPRDGKAVTFGKLPAAYGQLRWLSDGKSVTYMVWAKQADDPAAGVWVADFQTAPRQVFHGWATSSAVDAHDNIFIIKGKADLNGEVWRVKGDGSGLTRIPGNLPLLANLNNSHTFVGNQIDVSPDGHYIVFMSQQVLQENIGIIDNLQ